MTTHPIIDAQLAALAAELPEPLVAELADGYDETYAAHRRALDPDEAASATITEFGDATTICAAFAANSAGRRFARAVLVTGPVFGAAWATALLTQPTLRNALGIPARIAAGGLLLTVVVTLLATAVGRLRYRATRKASTAVACAILPFDVAAVATVIALRLAAPVTLVAVALSLTRIVFTAASLRTVQRT